MINNKTEKKKIKIEFLGILRHLRRLFYIRFRRKYVAEQLRKRKGTCKNCGCCATMIIHCKHFDKKMENVYCGRNMGMEFFPPYVWHIPLMKKIKPNLPRKIVHFIWMIKK